MADNIKIVGNILSTTVVSRYSSEDTKLIPTKNLTENFGGKNDYIEFYIYDIAGNLLNTDYNYLNYKLPPSTGLTPGTSPQTNTTGNIQTENVGIESTLSPQTSSLYPVIEIDPIQDLQNSGYSSGEFNVKYNLFQNILSNYTDEALFIKEISPDRTEVRLGSVSLTNDEIESVAISMIDKINNSDYYVDYLLNFGNNEQYIAINVALNKATSGYEILLKLYQPLPNTIQEKQTLWIVEEKVSPYVFDINLDKLVIQPPAPQLRGPNFGIEVPNHSTISTTYTNYSTLVTGLQSIQSSSYQQILNLLTTQSINISVDYTDFDNFIFFGSAKQRLSNFYTKVKQIEDYTTLISTYTPLISTTPSLITEINKYSSSINTIISQFDGYESYLYFKSSSYTWPKSGSLKPYKLLSTTNTSSINWYNNTLDLAEYYDKNNPNNLEYSIPNYLKDNPENQPFLTFINMVGHYFDNIWIYLKAITDISKANNNLDYGISKDLVYNQLKSLGLHLYNSQAGEDVDKFLIGSNTGSGIWDNNTTITGSYLNNVPRKDLVAELYKRIYHNLPLLLKQKGTVEGLDNLISIFGIPSRTYYKSGSDTFYTPTGSNFTASILNVKEYGGSNKAGLVKGYNTDKVRIIPNTITGSVLSPLHSLQSFPTNPSDFRDGDMHYVDISFSPQTQIDTYASKSIASNNSTWSLDDFIGDPRQQYNPTYDDLDTQRKLYYQTGISGYSALTGSLLDYNGFIRLIQYFDNALFKMLEDFVPERASLSTGVTINSPVLERNKASYANPTNSTTQSVYEAEYSSSNISAQYGHFYDALQDDKKPFFDGVISGSIIDAHDQFEDKNYNPYLLGNEGLQCRMYYIKATGAPGIYTTFNFTPCGSTTLASQGLLSSYGGYICIDNTKPLTIGVGDGTIEEVGPCDKNISLNDPILGLNSGLTYLTASIEIGNAQYQQFLHSEQNVLLNNVSKSVVSRIRKDIEYTGNFQPTSSITSSAELQDSYLTLRSYNTSRYEGSKTTSLKYNIYTEESGDIYSVYNRIDNIKSSFTSSYSYSYNYLRTSIFAGNPITTVQRTTPVKYSIINLYAPVASITETTLLNNLSKSKYIRAYTSNNISIGDNEAKVYEIKGYTRRLIPIAGATPTNYNTTSDEMMIFVSEELTNNPGKATITQDITPFSPPSQVIDLEFLNLNPNYYSGDKSYGKTTAIDHQSYKVGWVKNIPSQSLNFFDKTQIQLKYLVDANQNITDLTLKNNNLFEVQNTFKSGDNVVLSLSDAIKPSFQKTLDGTKSIFRGGYSYDPLIFRENNELLKFRFNESITNNSSFQGLKSTTQNFYSYQNSVASIIDQNWYGNGANPRPSATPQTSFNNWGYVHYKNYSGLYPGTYGIPESTPMATALNYNDFNTVYASSLQTKSWTKFNGMGVGVTYTTLSSTATWDFSDSTKIAYIFDDKLNFNNFSSSEGGYYNESVDVTENGLYLYKAPLESTYTIECEFPFLLRWAYYWTINSYQMWRYGNTNNTGYLMPQARYGFALKVYGVLEKSLTPQDPNSWEYAASTRVKEHIPYRSDEGGRYDSTLNRLIFPPLKGGGLREDAGAYGSQQLYNSINNLQLWDWENPTNPDQSKVNIRLKVGEVLRMRFFILDVDRFLEFGRDLNFEIGKPNLKTSVTPNINQTSTGISLAAVSAKAVNPYFKVTNYNNSITTYDNTLTITGSSIFTTTGSSIIFSDEMKSPLSTASVFVPDPNYPTTNYYSPVFDSTPIQPYDLIRIGSITNPNPNYYTVLNADFAPPEISLIGRFRVAAFSTSTYLIFPTYENKKITPLYELFKRLGSQSPSHQFIISDITGSNSFLNGTYTADIVPDPPPYASMPPIGETFILFGEDVLPALTVGTHTYSFMYLKLTNITSPLPTIGTYTDNPDYSITSNNSPLGGITGIFTLTDNYPISPYVVTVDREINLLSQPSQNFAILRPKPDETSVIINFKKSLGDVSQTILIPQDANDEIKNKVGTIFQSLNVDLSNQNQTNTQ